MKIYCPYCKKNESLKKGWRLLGMPFLVKDLETKTEEPNASKASSFEFLLGFLLNPIALFVLIIIISGV